MCERGISAAQSRWHLPNGLLQAIALVESGRPDPRTGAVVPWPWTINVAGHGYFFPNKASAIAAVRDLREAGIASIDVGCLQINLMYHPAAFSSLKQAFDPAANARYAALFLDGLHDRTGDWARAIGEYHSQTPKIAAPYQLRVLAQWHPPEGAVGFTPESAYQGMLSWEDVYQVPRSWEQVSAAVHAGQPDDGDAASDQP